MCDGECSGYLNKVVFGVKRSGQMLAPNPANLHYLRKPVLLALWKTLQNKLNATAQPCCSSPRLSHLFLLNSFGPVEMGSELEPPHVLLFFGAVSGSWIRA